MSSPHGAAPDRREGHLFLVAVALVVGLLGAIGAVVFRLMIRTVQAIAFDGSAGLEMLAEESLLAEASDPLASAQNLAWYWRIAIPAAGGAIVGPLVYFFAREARGHGVPEVMKAVALRGGVIRPRIVAIKSLASAISIGTGGSVGREGPIVQIGSAIGSAIGQLLGVPTRQLRTFVGCGAAAGISATFNAPIAGALFAAEVIVGDFAVAQFSPIVISSVVATVVSRAVLGNHPAFPVPTYEIVTPWEIAPYMVAGAVAGVVAVAFIRSISLAEDSFDRIPMPEWSKASLGGALVGVLAIGFPQVYGVGYTTIESALAGHLPALLLGALLLAKILATSITIGSGGSGGVFAPSLFLGAMTGGFLGSHIHAWFPETTAASGAYALVTMGAVVAAATQAPISAIIMIFELTQTINIIPALMVACVLSSLVSQLLSEDSVYTSKLKRQGIDLFKREIANPLKGLYVSEVLDEEPEVVRADASFQQMLDLVVQSGHTQFFVVDDDDQLLGNVALDEVRRLIFEREALQHVVVAGDLVEGLRVKLSPTDDLDVAMRLFVGSGANEIAVIDPAEPRRLLGTVHQRDVIEANNREMMRRDLAGGISSGVSAVSSGHSVELGGDYILQQIDAPRALHGHTIRELAIGQRTGAQVVLIRSGGRVRVPTADARITEGDELVVAGQQESIEKLERLR